jgi:acetyl-CoA carboxylase biotin carboxyl carrier protein
MDLTDEEVDEILGLIEDSKYDYLQIEMGDLKLTVNKGVAKPATPAPPAQLATEAPPAQPAPVRREGLVPVTAPMVGVFYAAPDPQAPPFVEKGSVIDEESTVGIIEVMKVFTGIRAGTSGKIAEILVSNQELVEYGQELFLVDPEGG